MNVNVWKTVKRAVKILRMTVSTHNELNLQAQLALAGIPQKAADFWDCSANVRAHVCCCIL